MCDFCHGLVEIICTETEIFLSLKQIAVWEAFRFINKLVTSFMTRKVNKQLSSSLMSEPVSTRMMKPMNDNNEQKTNLLIKNFIFLRRKKKS